MAIRSSRKKSHDLEAGDGSPSESELSSHNNNGDSNWLPDGWTVETKTRNGANSKGKRYKAKKRQRTTTVAVSSSDTMVKESVEVPWEVFVIAEQALFYRKKWEANPEDYRPKRDMKNAEKLLHRLTDSCKEDLPAGWKYDPETASTLVSRSPEDGGGELVSMYSPMPKDVINEEHKTRNCCGYIPPEDKRWRIAREKAECAKNNRELRVENLHSSTSDLELKQIFEAFGRVKRVDLPRDPETGHCYGFAYIEFARLKDSKAAVESLNGKKEIAGQTIKVCSLTAYYTAQDSRSANKSTKAVDTNGSKAAAMIQKPYEYDAKFKGAV